jgi:hypothetical protein
MGAGGAPLANDLPIHRPQGKNVPFMEVISVVLGRVLDNDLRLCPVIAQATRGTAQVATFNSGCIDHQGEP